MNNLDIAFKTYIKGARSCLCCSGYPNKGKLKKLLSKLRRRLDKKEIKEAKS